MSNAKAHVVKAPSRPDTITRPTIFLAGTTTPVSHDWRASLINRLSAHNVTFLDPARPDWDSTWKEDSSDPRWVDQVQWELEMQKAADVVVLFFHESTLAPISLLELGLSAPSGKVMACAASGYKKRGNVQAVCEMYNCLFVDSEEHLAAAVERVLKDKFGM